MTSRARLDRTSETSDILTCPQDRLEDELPDYTQYVRQGHEDTQEPPALDHGGILAQPATIQELHDVWIHQLAQQPPENPTPMVLITWYLDMERLDTCTQPREIELNWDVTQWVHQLFEIWMDHIDPAWPLNMHLVRPQPPATSRRPRTAVHLIVAQRSLHDQVANLFTIVDQRLPEGVQDLAAFAPIRLSKDDVIIATNYIDSCHSERSPLQCMTWHGDFELRGRVALRNRHELSIVFIYQEVFGSHTSDMISQWDQEDAEEIGLLQHWASSKSRLTLELDQLIPARTAVRLLAASGPGVLPSPLEIDMPGNAVQVRQELMHWGHDCEVFQCEPRNIFLCIDLAQEAQPDLCHYLFCHDDVNDYEGCFLHSAHGELHPGQLMSLLCSLDYPRAVIIKGVQLRDKWYRVIFHHSESQLAVQHRPDHIRTPWPEKFTAHIDVWLTIKIVLLYKPGAP